MRVRVKGVVYEVRGGYPSGSEYNIYRVRDDKFIATVHRGDPVFAPRSGMSLRDEAREAITREGGK